VTFVGQVNKKSMPDYYAAAKIVLVPLRNLDLFNTVIPSKIFEIMAMKKPIILSVSGEVKKLVVDEAKAGLYAEPENPVSICENIDKLFASNKKCDDLGINGRKYVEQHYTRESLAKQYLEYMEQIK